MTGVLSLVALFAVGAIGGYICKMSIVESGSLTMVNGFIAALVS